MFQGRGAFRIVATFVLILLLFGCVEEMQKTDLENPDNNIRRYSVSECRNITYETSECWQDKFKYSTGVVEKLQPYKMDIYCVGGGSVSVKNLEAKSGTFKVKFAFTTELEGKTTKELEQEIGPKETVTFKQTTQFRCSQEYKVEVEVIPPTKQVCGLVNKTREECVMR